MITIAVATMSTNFENTLKIVNSLSDRIQSISFLIVSQCEKVDFIEKIGNRITIIKSRTVGLSKSRNIAIDYVDSGWIWFQDDDIELELASISKVVSGINFEKPDIFFIQVGSLENKNLLYKKYDHYKTKSFLNFLKISSIEIIVRKEFVYKHNIRFNESMGLGSDLPCCEENKFILDCFNKSAKVFYSVIVACYHTTDVSSRNIDYIKNMKAKGYFLSFMPFWLSIALFARWSFKFSRVSNLSLYICLKLLIQGYLIKKD